MAKLHPELPQAIRNLSDKEKDKIILRFARSSAEMSAILAFELLDAVTLESLEQEGKENITHLLCNLSGRSVYKALNRAIGKAINEVARLKKITKDPRLEIDLIRHILTILFGNYSAQFENYNRSFPTKVARLTLKLHTLILKNLHPDFRIEYKPEVDEWLETLRSRSSRNTVVQTLPLELPE